MDFYNPGDLLIIGDRRYCVTEQRLTVPSEKVYGYWIAPVRDGKLQGVVWGTWNHDMNTVSAVLRNFFPPEYYAHLLIVPPPAARFIQIGEQL